MKLVALLFAPLGEGVLLALVVQLVRVRVRVRVMVRGRVTVRVRVRVLTLTLTPNPHLELLGVRVGDVLDLMKVRAGVRPQP